MDIELDFSEEINAKKRAGRKSGAQTPAKPSEKKKGSSKNKPGSAGEKGSKITFSAKVIQALKNKVSEHNKKHPSKKVTLSQLKKVYRRGAGAFSTSHRPGMTRGGWAMARVNTFLKMKRGGKVKKSYREADQDISKSSHDDLPEPSLEDCIAANIFLDQNDISIDFTEEDIFPEVEEEGYEEYIDQESWAKEESKGKTLNKPFRTPKGPKKFSVYVKNDKGNVVKVNFGDPNMEIKRDDPNRRKSFRARHNCDNPGPKTKARYWSCKQWRAGTKVKGSEDDSEVEVLSFLDESDGQRKGLWHNIREKKRREGKNYRPAKPGDKDRPTQEALKKAQGLSEKEKKEKEAFKPHTMYDKNGKKYMAKTYEDHLKFKKMGYTHEYESDGGHHDKSEAGNYLEKAFMSHCASYDKDLVNTAGMDKDKTYATCAMQYKKMKAMIHEKSEGGLTEKQKKLPPALQKAILKKQGNKSEESNANQNSPRAYAGDYLEKSFMSHCASYDKDLVNTAGMDKEKTYATCAMQYKKMKAMIHEESEGGLTEKQKKLPPALQKAILKKQGKANQNSPRMY